VAAPIHPTCFTPLASERRLCDLLEPEGAGETLLPMRDYRMPTTIANDKSKAP